MYNPEVLKQLNELAQEYEYRWGKALDYTAMPSPMSQERLLLILRRIVDTGESILVGWNYTKQ